MTQSFRFMARCFVSFLCLSGIFAKVYGEDALVSLSEFSVPKRGDDLVVPVQVGEKSRLFKIQTGASVTAVHSDLSADLGAKVRIRRHSDGHDSFDLTYFQPPVFQIGTVVWQGNEVALIDLRELRRESGHSISGILGNDFLRNHGMVVDYDHGKLQIVESPVPSDAAKGTRKRLIFNEESQVFYCFNRIPGGTIDDMDRFLIDTGLGISVGLREDLFDSLVKSGGIGDVCATTNTTPLQQNTATAGVLKAFDFAGTKHTSLLCARMKFNVIGNQLLSRYKITFDFPQRMMWLIPGERLTESDRPNLAHLEVVRTESNAVLIDDIDINGLAAIAGLRERDVILSVNEEKTVKLSLFEIRRKLSEPGLCRLTFERNGREKTVTLHLK